MRAECGISVLWANCFSSLERHCGGARLGSLAAAPRASLRMLALVSHGETA